MIKIIWDKQKIVNKIWVKHQCQVEVIKVEE